MKEQLEARIHELQAELESGQKLMMDLEEKRNNLSVTMLRIGGALQVLEELLAKEEEPVHA